MLHETIGFAYLSCIHQALRDVGNGKTDAGTLAIATLANNRDFVAVVRRPYTHGLTIITGVIVCATLKDDDVMHMNTTSHDGNTSRTFVYVPHGDNRLQCIGEGDAVSQVLRFHIIQ